MAADHAFLLFFILVAVFISYGYAMFRLGIRLERASSAHSRVEGFNEGLAWALNGARSDEDADADAHTSSL